MKKILCLILAALLIMSMAACGSSAGTTPDMNAVFASMSEKLPEMEPFSPDSVLNAYGVKSTDCVQEVVASLYDGSQTAEIWLIEAVSADALKTIKTLAENRLSSMGAQFQTYDAKAYALVQEAELITHGNCLCLIVAEDAAALADIYKTAAELK